MESILTERFIYLSVCLSIYLYIYVFIYLSIYIHTIVCILVTKEENRCGAWWTNYINHSKSSTLRVPFNQWNWEIMLVNFKHHPIKRLSSERLSIVPLIKDNAGLFTRDKTKRGYNMCMCVFTHITTCIYMNIWHGSIYRIVATVSSQNGLP